MNRILRIIEETETESLKFKPNPAFYKAIGINQKRWGLILMNKIDPTSSELQRIAKYFKVSILDLLTEVKEQIV